MISSLRYALSGTQREWDDLSPSQDDLGPPSERCAFSLGKAAFEKKAQGSRDRHLEVMEAEVNLIPGCGWTGADLTSSARNKV